METLGNQTNKWMLDGLSAVESRSEETQTFAMGEGPDHVILLRQGKRCPLSCEIGGRTLNGHSGAGQFFLVPKGTVGSFHCTGPHVTWIVYLSDQFLRTACRASDRDQIRLRSLAFKTDPIVQSTVSNLMAEFKGNDIGRTAAALALSHMLAVLLVRRYSEPKQHETGPLELPPHRLKQVLQYIDEHCCQEISLVDLAETVQLSPHYFLRLFKQSTGVTPHNFILRKRIERAKTLLADNDLGLADIALELGFPSQSHFGTIFKKMTGVTPKSWRRNAE